MTPINLMPHERLVKQMVRRRRRAWLRFLRTYSIALAVGSVLIMLPAHASNTSQEASLSRLDGQIERSQAGINDNKKKIADLATRLEVSRFVGEHPDWSLVMEAVSRSRADWVGTAPDLVGVRVSQTDIALETFELAIMKTEAKPAKASGPAASSAKAVATRESYSIHITGFASSPASAIQFVRRLEKLEFAESVVVRETRAQPLGKAMVTHFDIDITISGDRTNPSASDSAGGASK